jgi:hypothetical protein
LDYMLIFKNMKRILYLAIFTLFIACEDDNIIEGTAMAFYPTTVIEVVEQDETQYAVIMSATGKLDGAGAVTIKIDNHQFIGTVPSHNNGLLTVDVDAEGFASFTVEALNDDIPDSYVATFKVVGTQGAVTAITSSTFSLVVTDDDVASTFSEDFEVNGINSWNIENIGSGNNWQIGDFAGNTYVDISNFNAAGITESWLISEEIDFVSGENEFLTFDTQTRFNDEDEIFTAYIVSDYVPGSDPSGASLIELDFERDPHEGGGFGSFTTSGIIDLSQIDKISRIAFYYKAASDSDGSGWSLDNVALQSFDPNNSGPVGDPLSFALPFTDDLNACGNFSIPDTFIQERVSGSKQDRGWECSSNGVSGSQAVRASALGGVAGAVDAWLISAKTFDLSSTSEATLTFDIKSATSGSGTINILWSEDYSGVGEPTNATWTAFAGFTTPDGGSDAFVTTDVDIQAALGKSAYIAFQFVGGTHSNSASFDIDNITVAAGSGGGGSGGGGGGGGGTVTNDTGDCDLTGAGTVIVSHDFEGCSDDFSVPNGFIEENVPGTKTDRGWGCRDDGTDGSRGVRASAFGGDDGTDDAWLIMDSFDASSFTEISLTFDVQSPFSGPGDLLVLYSNDYTGSGDPTSANWTQLDNITAQLPVQGAGEFATVTTSPCNLSGSAVYIAFRYIDGTSSESSAWSIDNLELRGN